MKDDFLSRSGEVIKQLKNDIDELDAMIRRAEEHRSRIREQLSLHEQALAVYRQVMELPRTPEEQLPLIGGLRGTIADMCAQVMEARGGPVTVRELVNILTAAGKFRNPEKDRGNYGTVFGTLQRDERFAKKRGKGEFYLISKSSPNALPLVSSRA
jgi:hypothetical protein